MMNELNSEARAFLNEFQEQPEGVRRIFIYVICQTMEQAGLLQLMGVFNSPGIGVTLIYKNPESGEIFEVIKPDISNDEEQAMRTHIGELLQEEARTAV